MGCDSNSVVCILEPLAHAITEINRKLASLQVSDTTAIVPSGPGYTQSLPGTAVVCAHSTMAEMYALMAWASTVLKYYRDLADRTVSAPLWYAFRSFKFEALTDILNPITRLCPSSPGLILV
jgi:glutamate synthase domain-containing protein 1